MRPPWPHSRPFFDTCQERCWCWTWGQQGQFSVTSAYDLIADGGISFPLKEVWRPSSLLKVKILLWRMLHGHLPTVNVICRFLLDIVVFCSLCCSRWVARASFCLLQFCVEGVGTNLQSLNYIGDACFYW